MSLTHYYYALNRKAAEPVLDLTCNQFLARFGWPGAGEWDTLGKFLAYSVDRPLLEDAIGVLAQDRRFLGRKSGQVWIRTPRRQKTATGRRFASNLPRYVRRGSGITIGFSVANTAGRR